MTDTQIPTIPEVPSLTDTRNTFALATAAGALDPSVKAQLGRRDQEVIEKAIAGKLPNDKEYILVRVLFKADMIMLRATRDEIVGIACDFNWLGTFGTIGRTLLIDLPEPRGEGSMKKLRKQRGDLHKALTDARKRVVDCMERFVEREAARAAEAEAADDQSDADAGDVNDTTSDSVAAEPTTEVDEAAEAPVADGDADVDTVERELVTTG